ncbi:MAG: ATP synthase F1 subunit epsilon [Verrucomicrobiales bacterium]|nr:ATP synthase F1 subunit epsilon [Verrucomicrobiales bacterium]
MAFHLDIVTPEKKTFSDDVDSVVVPGIDGEFGVLTNHAALVTVLKPGELRYTKGAETVELAVGEGLVEVLGDRVSILTDLAVTHHEIDEDVVQKALDRAKLSLEELSGEEELAAVQAAIQKSMAQLHLKRKRRHL